MDIMLDRIEDIVYPRKELETVFMENLIRGILSYQLQKILLLFRVVESEGTKKPRQPQ